MKKVLFGAATLLMCLTAEAAFAQNIVVRGRNGGVVAAGPYGVRIAAPRVAPAPRYVPYNRGFQGITVAIGPSGLITRFPNTGIANRYSNIGLARRR